MNHLRLYLDDERKCPEGWTLAKTVQEAREIITSHLSYDESNTFEVSLDFDLGEDNEMTHEKGVMLIYWFMDVGHYPTQVYLHTANPVGRRSMEWVLAEMEVMQDA